MVGNYIAHLTRSNVKPELAVFSYLPACFVISTFRATVVVKPGVRAAPEFFQLLEKKGVFSGDVQKRRRLGTPPQSTSSSVGRGKDIPSSCLFNVAVSRSWPSNRLPRRPSAPCVRCDGRRPLVVQRADRLHPYPVVHLGRTDAARTLC